MKKYVSRNEIEYLFRNAYLNVTQIEKIVEVAEILGKYIFLDRNLLEKLSRDRIGLSFLRKASDYDIIVEMMDEGGRKDKNIYYFQLGIGGKYLLQLSGKKFHNLNIAAGRKEKENILTYNYFAYEKGFDISTKYSQSQEYSYFFCDDNIICYYQDQISDKEVAERLINYKSKDISFNKIFEMFNFIPIDKKRMKIGSQTKKSILFK